MRETITKLIAFSLSLAAKDIEASGMFYAKRGFTVFGGDAQQNCLIRKNGDHLIRRVQGMLENNILAFNPVSNSDAHSIDESPTFAHCSDSSSSSACR